MTVFPENPMSNRDANAIGSLALAHIGDAVFELLTRAHLIEKGFRSAKSLHRSTVEMVSAGAQAAAGERLIPLLSEDELAVFMRGRNTQIHSYRRSVNRADYQAATALEALFGYLFLTGRLARAMELFGSLLP